MLRIRRQNESKPAPAQFKNGTGGVVKTGSGVVLDLVTNEFKYPSTNTAANIYVADQERYLKGINAAYNDQSDYFEDFVEIPNGERAKLMGFGKLDKFATDQYVATGLTVGNRLMVNTSGQWVRATGTIASVYVFAGIVKDNGRDLMDIEVYDTPAAN